MYYKHTHTRIKIYLLADRENPASFVLISYPLSKPRVALYPHYSLSTLTLFHVISRPSRTQQTKQSSACRIQDILVSVQIFGVYLHTHTIVQTFAQNTTSSGPASRNLAAGVVSISCSSSCSDSVLHVIRFDYIIIKCRANVWFSTTANINNRHSICVSSLPLIRCTSRSRPCAKDVVAEKRRGTQENREGRRTCLVRTRTKKERSQPTHNCSVYTVYNII
jgi:hypothetical protein